MTTQTGDHPAVPRWTLTDRLRKSREYAGMKQQDLADALEISRGAVGNYEQGTVVPKRPVLVSWAIATGVPFEWLRTGIMPNPPDNGGDLGDPTGADGAGVPRRYVDLVTLLAA